MIYTLTASPRPGIIAKYLDSIDSFEEEDNSNYDILFSLSHANEPEYDWSKASIPDMVCLNIYEGNLSRFKTREETCFLISTKLYKVLKSFILPKFSTYNAGFILKEKILEISYIFIVFKSTLKENILPELTKYKIISRIDRTRSKTLGFYENISNENLKKLKLEHRKRNELVLVDILKTKTKYNIMWGGTLFAYVDENTYKYFSTSNLTGIDIYPFRKFTITALQ